MILTLFAHLPSVLMKALELDNIDWPWQRTEHQPAPEAKWCRDLTTRQTLLALIGESGDFWQIHARWNLGHISGEEYAAMMRKRWHDEGVLAQLMLGQLS